MPNPFRSPLWIALALLATGLLAWFAYDTFQTRYLRPFDPRATLFDGEALRLPDALAGPGPIRVVHFWDPACPCNVANQQHLTELVARFASDDVQFYVQQKPGSHGRLPDALAALQRLDPLPGSSVVAASPAVAIWDREGRLAYFGPYSEGAVCNASNSFIEPALKAVLADRPVGVTHALAVGCYCPWSDAQPREDRP